LIFLKHVQIKKLIIIKTKEINARLSTIKNKINFFREKFSSSSESSDLSLTPIKEYNIRSNHMRMNDFITITESAQKYLAKLVSEKEDAIYNVRVFVSDPGTPRAETCLAFCKAGEEKSDDIKLSFKNLIVFVEKRSQDFLLDAEINFDTDNFGGQLTIKSPNSRLPNISDDSPLEDKINYVLYNEINPMLESHGGEVSLQSITDDHYAVLQFGGGCQGCGMVDVTLKEGVEKTLLEQVKELKGVKDVTDHSFTDNAYY